MLKRSGFVAAVILLLSMALPGAAATPLGPPSPPMALTAAFDGASVNLAWEPPVEGTDDVAEYRVYRFANATKEFVATVPADTTTFEDGDVEPGTTYSYYVTAANAEGESAPSNLGIPYPHCRVIAVHPGIYINEGCLFPLPVIGYVRIG